MYLRYKLASKKLYWVGGGWIQKAKIKPTQPSWSLAELGNIFKIGIVSYSVLTELIESVSHILDWFPQVPDWSPQVPDCVPHRDTLTKLSVDDSNTTSNTRIKLL